MSLVMIRNKTKVNRMWFVEYHLNDEVVLNGPDMNREGSRKLKKFLDDHSDEKGTKTKIVSFTRDLSFRRQKTQESLDLGMNGDKYN